MRAVSDADGPETTKPARVWKNGMRRGFLLVRFKRRINSILMFRVIPQTEARVGDSF